MPAQVSCAAKLVLPAERGLHGVQSRWTLHTSLHLQTAVLYANGSRVRTSLSTLPAEGDKQSLPLTLILHRLHPHAGEHAADCKHWNPRWCQEERAAAHLVPSAEGGEQPLPLPVIFHRLCAHNGIGAANGHHHVRVVDRRPRPACCPEGHQFLHASSFAHLLISISSPEWRPSLWMQL